MKTFTITELLNDLKLNELKIENDEDSVINDELTPVVKKYKSFIKNDEKTKYDIGYLNTKIQVKDRLDNIYQLAWVIFTHEYGMIPSEFYVDKEIKIEFLDFIKKNGKLLFKKMGSKYIVDNNYLFLYNGMYISFCLNFSKFENGYINGLTIYHKIDQHIPYDIFSEFWIEDKKVSKIGIIKISRYGPAVSWMDHTNKHKFDLNHYNPDFLEYFDSLKQTINTTENGLYLMYGEAGTGKSSAIRHLITKLNRKVVFIPPQMINCLSNPDFTDLVTTELKDCVLVIEDAEKALMKRETADGFSNSELVSSILNLTDGLYADICKTSIIATYNCNRNLIDPALLRKGRLLWEYHFRKLEIERSKNLMKSLGHEEEVTEEMTLADIFNYKKQIGNDVSKKPKKKVIGFAKS